MKQQPVQLPKPTSLLDPRFKYVPAASTDIRKTFERVRREMAAKGKK